MVSTLGANDSRRVAKVVGSILACGRRKSTEHKYKATLVSTGLEPLTITFPPSRYAPNTERCAKPSASIPGLVNRKRPKRRSLLNFPIWKGEGNPIWRGGSVAWHTARLNISGRSPFWDQGWYTAAAEAAVPPRRRRHPMARGSPVERAQREAALDFWRRLDDYARAQVPWPQALPAGHPFFITIREGDNMHRLTVRRPG